MKNFTPDELTKCNPPCKWEDVEIITFMRIDRARDIAGIPFVLLSVYRSPEYEISMGRNPSGVHTTGKAFDIRAQNSRERFKIVVALLAVGFTRIGIYDWGAHVDDCMDKDQQVIWKL